jgi:hypothetical protein
MSNQAAFDKAVQIVKDLPADGPVKPSQDDQLAVSVLKSFRDTATAQYLLRRAESRADMAVLRSI